MEKVLKLYSFVDGVNDTPFPSEDEQVIIADFRCDYKRMGAAPTITCSVQHYLCLDNLWSYHVYTQFNGERFFIKQIPSSSFDNTDARYKHDVELVSERVILDNVYFYDVVTQDYEYDKPVSNSSNVVFFGTIHEFAERLNHSLNYSGVDYSVVVDEGITSEGKLMSFQDQFFSNVLQEINNTYDIPYYFVGKVIHIGYADNEIAHTFKYGANESLISIKKQNANHKVVNRITGVGSSENIPYYYPNFDNKGITEVLYNNEQNKASVFDLYKYNKVKLNDKFSYEVYKEDDKTLLDNAFFTNINYTHTDSESQYSITFDYKFTLKNSSDIKFLLISTYQDTDDIFCEIVDSKGNNIGDFHNDDIKTNLANGSYILRVVWLLHTTQIMNRPYAEELIFDNISVNAISIGKSTYWWELNGKRVDLKDYGISTSVYAEVGDTITVNQLSYIKKTTNLMPSIYRESNGFYRFYNAKNNSYINHETNDYYTFNNPYIVGKPKEHIENSEDIKPTINGVTNAENLRIDMFSEFAFDENDNDEFNEEGYKHPYFYGKLRKFDGEHGFNLFDHAIENSEMTIAMTSGSCGGCEFIIGVDEESQKNLVQVDENGNLLRDENGNIRSGREGMPKETPQDQQNDTRYNEVWIALKKEESTFGVIMPNAEHKYHPNEGDTFVILHINLPQAYIIAAEDRLEQSLIKYMSENNDEKFTFSIEFSRIFFAENPIILEQLNENSRITIEYNERQYQLYISSYSYNMSNDKSLPEIRIELSDVLTIPQNSLTSTITELKSDVLSNINLSETQFSIYTANVKKDLNSKVDTTKQEITQTINEVETSMQEYTKEVKTILHESIKGVNDSKVNVEDVYSKDVVDENFVNVGYSQEILGEKDFKGGLKVNGNNIEYDTTKGCWILNGHLVLTGGITMYAQDGNIHIPTIAEGLPFDNRTIWFNPTTKQIEVIGGTGGGEGGVSNFWDLNGIPSWITISKPTYTYNEIKNTPDLSAFALKSDIPSLDGYATQSWVTQQGFLTEHQDLSGYQTKITSSNKLAYSLISGTPDLSIYALKSSIPSLNGYATESWVLGKGYATTSDLDGRINALINGAPQAYDTLKEIADVLQGNVNSIGDILITLGNKADKATTLGGYGITDAKIANGVITLGKNTITPLTSHQAIYTLTFQSGTFASGSFTANSANKTINIPTTTSHISEGSNLYFTNARAVSALTDTLKAYVTLSGTQTITGEKNFIGGLKVNGSPLVYNKERGYWKLEGDLLVTGGVSMFASDTDFTPSTIMDAIVVDNVTIIKQDGKLVALGGGDSGGGVADSVAWGNVLGKPSWITDSAPIIGISGVNVSLGSGISQSSLRTALGLGSLAYKSSLGKADVGLGNVENTALSTWTGTSKINTLGTITAGTWNGTKIANAYLANSAITISGTSVSLGGSITQSALRTALGLGSNAYSSTAYLPLTGGTIGAGNSDTFPLMISSTNDYMGIVFASKTSTAYFRYLGGARWNVTNDGWTASYDLWHSGNDGSGSGLDADLLDGNHANDLSVHKSRILQSYDDTTLDNTGLKCYYGTINKGETTDGTWCSPDGSYNGVDYGSVVRMVHFSAYYTDIFLNTKESNIKYRQVINSSSKGWKTIATLTDNVASATKLQTPRTIWGQSFDGTGNVSGHLQMKNNTAIKFANADGDYYSSLAISTENKLNIGYGTSGAGHDTNLYGNNICIRYGTSRIIGMFLNQSGNVTIGSSDLASTTAKLHVAGRILSNSTTGKTTAIADNIEGVSYNSDSTAWAIGAKNYYNGSNTNYGVGLKLALGNATETNKYFGISCVAKAGYGNVYNLVFESAKGVHAELDYNGNLLVMGGITFNSMRSLKNIQDERGLSLDELSTIKPTRFTWKDGRDDRIHIGGIADDVQKVLPEVIYNMDNVLCMDYGNAAFAIATSLIKPVSEHEKEIQALKEKVKVLEQEIEILKWHIA